ncbi:MAG: hypothetical protein IIY34_07455, partial [Clostridia bacterium]|nr:hypothetical protein [Clostridia bacterium]
MKHKLFTLLSLILAFSLIFSACGKEADAVENADAQDSAVEESVSEPEPTEEELLSMRAHEIVDNMTTEERAAQLFLVRFDKESAVSLTNEYCPGGFILFGKDFKEETPESIRELTASLQFRASTPLIFGVDEEGGTVARVSRYAAFRAEKFRSPQSLYNEGGLDLIRA